MIIVSIKATQYCTYIHVYIEKFINTMQYLIINLNILLILIYFLLNLTQNNK